MILHDGCTSDPKILRAGPEAAWLWVCAIDYARRHLTNGLIDADVLPTLGRFKRVKALAETLVEVGLLHRHTRGYTINKYLEYNDSREVAVEKRSAAAQRTARWRERHGHAAPSEPALHSDGVTGSSGDASVTASHVHTESVSNASRQHHSRARVPAFGVGVGTGVVDLASGEGEPERERAGGQGVWLAADVWELWARVATQHGADLRLGARPRETEHCMALAAAYTPDELTPLVEAWWASAHTGGRNLGLFVAQAAEVAEHLASGSTAPFRAPAPAKPARRDVPAHVSEPCPHATPCASTWACKRKRQIEELKAQAS